MNTKPIICCILDGWGESDVREHNAILQARTPNWDRLKSGYPFGLLNASEGDVGLPQGQMGNSEVGHMNIGAGRVVMQDLPRIDNAIADGSLENNPQLLSFIDALKKSGGTCHLMGLLSDGGVHSHVNHMAALANIVAAAGVPVAVHAFTDGRDTPPQSALTYIAHFQELTKKHSSNSKVDALLRVIGTLPYLPYLWVKGCPTLKRRYTTPNSNLGSKVRNLIHNSIFWPIREALKPVSSIQFGVVMGRYYAMDRDTRWERIEAAYQAMTNRDGDWTNCAENVVNFAYDIKKVTDEFIPPSVIDGFEGMRDGDGVLMANFRADRARQILTALLDPEFNAFERTRVVKFAATLGMVEYSDALNRFMPALFPTQDVRETIGELVANAGKKQLRIAETEKYAHVTFFFNGGREEPFKGEERILVPSPKVATYDLKPEMSAFEVTDKLVAAIESGAYDFIVVNYANTDMVGHSGDITAAIKAVEAVDACLGRLSDAALKAGGALLISADHGNAECMHDADGGQPHTAHTLNLVPCIIVSESLRGASKLPTGILADIAPTLLALLGLPQPKAMTGRNLLAHDSHASVA